MTAKVLSLLLTLLVGSFGAAWAEQSKLRISFQLPIDTHLGVNLTRFKEEVEKASDKEIVVEIYDRARLYKDKEKIQAVASGAIEMATLPATWFGAKVPAVGIYDQPFLMNFEALVRAVSSPDSSMRQLLDAAILEALGVRPLWWQSYGSTVFLSKNGRHTKLPSAISGQKIRVFGDTMGEFIKLCGGIPLSISASEQYRAARDGIVDMIITGITTVEPRELWKVVDTVTRTEHGAIEWPVIINEKVWQALSKRHQQIIAEAARKVERELRDQMAEIEGKAYAFAREKGMQIYELTSDEVAEWRVCSAPMIEGFMDKTGEIGVRLMAGYAKLRTHPCCSAGPSTAAQGR
ncbi:MAG: TRAP transporter substrate-binding protein DctP [Hyphomicrobiaceae bacterium]|nr:TRAP transporter substrate-binding protein DctP [Hyphomicrobiaceae bacterium]